MASAETVNDQTPEAPHAAVDAASSSTTDAGTASGAGSAAVGRDAEAALLRWRLVLGENPCPHGGACNGTGEGAGRGCAGWGRADAAIGADGRLSGVDDALGRIYNNQPRGANLAGSAPWLPAWLGDIRRYFPGEMVSFIQKDAIERRGLRSLVMEPETLHTLEKDIGLVATLVALKEMMPEETKRTAREVVGEIVEDLRRRLEARTRQAIVGALRRDMHSPLSVARNLDVRRTIRTGLKNYQPELGRIIPERIYFHANQQRRHEWQVVCLVDQSGSMAESVVYASIIAAVFASLPALDTRLVFFDTAVVDVSEQLSDPVDVIFGANLGGGTDIARAVAYGSTLVERPEKTLFILITDLYEGGSRDALLTHLAALKESRATVLCVLALNDAGMASYDRDLAKSVANLDIPTFAATPNRLVDAVVRSIQGEHGSQGEQHG